MILAVEGLPESVAVLELIDLSVELVMSGIIFGLIPALPPVSTLRGKIEPLM